MRTTSEVTAASPGRSSIASSGEVRVLRTLRALFDALQGAGVRYCHWKSNWKLVEALRGERDLDLLVHRGDASRFLSVVGAVGCKPGRSDGHPSLCHYYGFDEESGRVFDLHVYHRIITGGTIKEYHLPLESALLRGARPPEEGVCVPERAAERVSSVMRRGLDYAVPSEALIPRDRAAASEDLRWPRPGVDAPGLRREVDAGPRAEPLAGGRLARGQHPRRQAAAVDGDRSPAPSPAAAAADDAGLPDLADRHAGGSGEGDGLRRDACRRPGRLCAAGADGGVREEAAPDPGPPQGRGRDPGRRRSVPDPPAGGAGRAEPPLPAREPQPSVQMAGAGGGADVPRHPAARPRLLSERPARAGRASKPHAGQTRRAGADRLPPSAPRAGRGAGVWRRPHVPDPYRRDGRGDPAVHQAHPVEGALTGV